MSFDFKIENYSRDDLIEIFQLPEYFDKNTIEVKENYLKNSILNNTEINKETKEQTINFILKAKNVILNGIQNKTNNGPATYIAKEIENFYNSSYKLKSTKLKDSDEHMVQVRPEKPYLTSYPSEFFPGIINPLKKRTIKKNLNIDTRFRENYYTSPSTNFNLNLPINIKNVVQMQLGAIEIPKTYYAISKQYGNNFFTINANGLSQVITIPTGNYDQTTIINAVNNQLSLLSAPFNQITFAVNLTGVTGSVETLVGFSDLTGNTSLELNFQADKFGIDDKSTPLPLKFGWLLGFRNGLYVNNLNYVSEGVINISGSSYFFLVVDDRNNNVNNNFYSAFNSSILNQNILARISSQVNSSFSLIEQNNLGVITTPREYFGPVDIQIMNIQLLDEYGRVVDLNNMDFSFCLTLTTVYDL
jgi:hypothetical protein